MNKQISVAFLALMFVLFASVSANAQQFPSEAQIRKDVMNPGVIAIIFHGAGSVEKFVTNGAVVDEYYRAITVRRKTDKPGVTLDVIGDVVYRLIGRRWVYRTMRLAGNQYGGIKAPTISEINQALAGSRLDEFNGNGTVIGEYESLKMAPVPNWEWHTPNSVSFNVIAVYWIVNYGKSYSGQPRHEAGRGFRTVDHLQTFMRLRIYRDNEGSPWSSAIDRTIVLPLQLPNAKGEMINRAVLLGFKDYSNAEINALPRMSKLPLLTQ
jgi:hypothetical protein